MPQNRIPTWLHPASGLLILSLDWLLFSGGVLTLGLSTPVLLVSAALLTAGGVMGLQRRFADDGRRTSLLKGLAGGIAVGLPLPIAGTGVGGLVLALSGLNRLRRSSSETGSDENPPSSRGPSSD
jgi:hypothetical protein